MRVELGGRGYPIPNIALPDPLLGDVPNQILTLENGVPFDKEDWVGLGYTHYEAFVVGGSGGRGGDTGTSISWSQRRDPSIVSYYTPEEWEEIKNWYIRSMPPYGSGSHLHYGNMVHMPAWNSARHTPPNWCDNSWTQIEGLPLPGQPGAPTDGLCRGVIVYPWITPPYFADHPNTVYDYTTTLWSFNPSQMAERNNPSHIYHPILFHHPQISNIVACGGGGGGGGFHAISGELEDLPDLTPVVVGKAGTDAPYGVATLGSLTGIPPQKPNNFSSYANGWVEKYPPNLHTSEVTAFSLPGPGQDGGFSSFNNDMCRASGGKGGGPSAIYAAGKFQYTGYGGEGGLGGRVTAGGGGPGSTDYKLNGSDGRWDGVIGGGGGGGRGGAFLNLNSTDPNINREGTAGGRGVFSFTDTTIYGARNPKTILPIYTINYYDPVTGAFSSKTSISRTVNSLVAPGGGGGVRVLRKMKFGSDTVGYSSDGAVILRLSKRD